MSGHSKWSQIKRQKGAADVRRGASFSKLSNAIIVAAKSGGDPNTNFTLKMAVEKAKVANMPKDTIERAIKRGTGEIAGAAIEETLYEVITHDNIGIIIQAATDNKNRTTAELKNILNKAGAKLATSGAVTYQFHQMGKIIISIGANPPAGGKEDLELMLIDAGAEDFEEAGDEIIVFTKPHDLELTKKALENQSLEILEADLSWEPQTIIKIDDSEKSDKIINLIEALESLDDVVAVFSNFDLA